MRRMNRAVPLTMAVASGLATMGLIHLYISSQQPANATELVPMVITQQPVDDSEPLTAEDLRVVQVSARPAGAFASPSDVVGRLPLVKVPQGQPLLSSHLAEAGVQPGLWNAIPAGKRAVTVAINEVAGVGGFLKPGLFVDIIGVVRTDGDWTSRTVCQMVPILAIAQEDKSDKGEQKAKIVKSATLLVSPQQAEAIALASEEGKIRLVLRAPGDTQVVRLRGERRIIAQPKPAPAAPAVVYHAPPPPAPARHAPPPARPAAPPPPPMPAGIEVIRGTATEVVTP